MINIRLFLAILCSIILLEATIAAQSNSSTGLRAARRVSDSFIADLVANRIGDAIEKAGRLDRNAALSQYTEMLGNCGRPLDSKVANYGKPVVGEDVWPDGSKRNTLIFQYICKSTRHSAWVFRVEVEMAEDAKYRVSGWGCAKPDPSGATSNK